jgi:hypothetical protein
LRTLNPFSLVMIRYLPSIFNSAQIPGIGLTAPVSAGTQPSRMSNDSTDKPLARPYAGTPEKCATHVVHGFYDLRCPQKQAACAH